MNDLRFYRWMSGFGWVNYRAKIMVMAFIGTHIPLIALASYFAFQASHDWGTFFVTVGITLVATLVGTGITLFVLNELLLPVIKTSKALRSYRDSRTVTALPTHFTDEVGTLMADAGTTIAHLETVRDMLEHVDATTGLPNRRRLLSLLEKYAATDKVLALGVIRYANLQRIVEALDTVQADLAMKTVADRLGAALPANVVLARAGENELALILPGLTALEAGSLIAGLIKVAGADVVLRDLALTPDLVCGVAEFPGDADTMSTLLDQALGAAATASPAAPMTYHSPKARAQSVERLRMEQDLRRALEHDEFRLHFQPVVNLRAGRVQGAEALIRWQHPAQGLVAPGKFIPTAESSGLIDPIGLWVMRETCAQIARWNAEGRNDLKVAINLSARQFLDPDLRSHVFSALEAARISPEQLEIELTETAAMADHEHTRRVFTALRDLGVSIAIDDFGTGYASMSYLRKLPFDKLKIDREFVTDVHQRQESQAICEALIALSRGLHLNVLAEGAETEQEVDYLAGIGCDLFQGYFFARPMPATDFSSALNAINLQATMKTVRLKEEKRLAS